MIFSSLIFLFAFLPIALGIYYLLPASWKNYFLILVSLIFFAWGGVSYSIIIVSSITFNYLLGLFLDKKYKRIVLLLGLTLNIGILFYFKYLGFLITNLFYVFSIQSVDPNSFDVVLPIGISFYTFQAISYLIDAYQGKVKIQKRLDQLALYIILFPQLIAGPIVRYYEIKDQIKERKHSLIKFSSGVSRFAFGLGKKVLIANVLGEYSEEVFLIPIDKLDLVTAWAGASLYAFQIYFDFSGYSDMAIGLGKMFGFDFPENFNFPYAARSIKDFWRRWHITLSSWFRDYLYIPLGGSRGGKFRTLLNLTIVFIITGFWHGAAWNFLIWGLIHGLFIVIERAGLSKLLSKAPNIVGILYTCPIVIVAWVFFREENLQNSLDQINIMFGGGEATEINYPFLSQFLHVRLLLVIGLAFLFSTGILSWIYDGLKTASKHFSPRIQNTAGFTISIVSGLTPVAIMFLCMIELNLNSYNPFIYFRF